MSWKAVFVLCLVMGLILTEIPGANAGLIRRVQRQKRRANKKPCRGNGNPMLPQCKFCVKLLLLLLLFFVFVFLFLFFLKLNS